MIMLPNVMLLNMLRVPCMWDTVPCLSILFFRYWSYCCLSLNSRPFKWSKLHNHNAMHLFMYTCKCKKKKNNMSISKIKYTTIPCLWDTVPCLFAFSSGIGRTAALVSTQGRALCRRTGDEWRPGCWCRHRSEKDPRSPQSQSCSPGGCLMSWPEVKGERSKENVYTFFLLLLLHFYKTKRKRWDMTYTRNI